MTLAPAEVAALEARVAQHPEDPGLGLELARAYYGASRFADARRALGPVLAADSSNAEARAYLGLSYEGLAEFDSARAVYTQLAAKDDRRVRHLLAGRLALLTRTELQYAARQALARESSLVQTPPDPNTVAVMPFRYTGPDTTYRPLARGLTALVITDLAHVSRLRLVERVRVQVLLDELKLAESGRVDPATGARSGRLVGAGQVVEGQFTTAPADQFRLDATVVRAADAGVAATGSNTDRVRALFDMEKAVVFELLGKLGITLTPAEQVAISERPTRDVEAFLLYSRGLEAEDQGNFAAAAEAFRQAVTRDPGFRAAADERGSSAAAQDAAGAPATDLANATAAPSAPASGTILNGINGAVPTGANALQTVLSSSSISGAVSPGGGGAGSSAVLPPPSDPNRICEGASCDGPARAALTGTVIIILKRP